MPVYHVTIGDESEIQAYNESLQPNEVVTDVEMVPFYDNNIHLDNEQHPVILSHFTAIITTAFRHPDLGFIGPMEYRWTRAAYDSYRSRGTTPTRKVSPQPRVSSPKRGKKKTSGARSRKNVSSSSSAKRCPKGFYYDSKRKMCVRIKKGRKQNASKKKFWNGKRR